jgi:FlaA1/EpsC-like NDP-sugar epimerase
MLLAADVLGLVVAFAATELLFRGGEVAGDTGIGLRAAIFGLLIPVWVVAAKLYGLYDGDEERATHSTADEVVRVFHLITVGVWLFYASSWLVGLADPQQAKLTTFWLLALIGVTGMRSIARTLARRHPAYVQNTVIVGAGARSSSTPSTGSTSSAS